MVGVGVIGLVWGVLFIGGVCAVQVCIIISSSIFSIYCYFISIHYF